MGGKIQGEGKEERKIKSWGRSVLKIGIPNTKLPKSYNMMTKISTHQTKKSKEIQVRTIIRNNVDMMNTTRAFSISVFIGFCRLGLTSMCFQESVV